MNKPDFEALLRQIGGGVISKSVVINLCEHVWNTHVVPLQESLRIEREAHDKSMSDIKAIREENTKCKELSWEAANEISRLKKEIDRLKAEVLKEKFPEN